MIISQVWLFVNLICIIDISMSFSFCIRICEIGLWGHKVRLWPPNFVLTPNLPVCTPTTRMRILLNSHCLNTQNEVLINHSIDSSDTCRHRTSSCENVRGCFYSFWARSQFGHELLQQKLCEKINQRTKQEAHGSVVLEKKKL